MLGVRESKESTDLLFCIHFKQHLVVRHMLLCPTVSSWICSRPARPLSAQPTAAVAWSCRALASPVFRVVCFLGVSSRDVVPFSWDAHLAIRACRLATTSKTCLFVLRKATFGSSFLFCFVYVVLCTGVGCMGVILLAGQKPFCELLQSLVFVFKKATHIPVRCLMYLLKCTCFSLCGRSAMSPVPISFQCHWERPRSIGNCEVWLGSMCILSFTLALYLSSGNDSVLCSAHFPKLFFSCSHPCCFCLPF